MDADMMIEATAPEGTWLPARVVFGRTLQHFYKTAKKRVLSKLGILDDEFQRREVQWIITVPSIWGERAKGLMKEAAKEVMSALLT